MIAFIQRYLIAGLAAVILASCAFSGYLWLSRSHVQTKLTAQVQATKDASAQTEVARAQTESTQRALAQTKAELESAREAIKAREENIRNITKAKEASDAKLQKALNGNRDWSDTPLPSGVRDALREAD